MPVRPSRVDHIHGLRLYHLRCCQKRKHGADLFQYHYAAAVHFILLSGTFFSTTAFPVLAASTSAEVLPLTYLNDAMRKVAFEGAGLGDVTH